MSGLRLDNFLVEQAKTSTRSQAENFIKLGLITVDGLVIYKPSHIVSNKNVVLVTAGKKYVSRGGFKLESIAKTLCLDFNDKAVLDVGSSTGGFSDYALQHGATKIIAVDVGTNQMVPALRLNPKVELHEQTDIRSINLLSTKVNIVLIDVSFISVRTVLKHLTRLIDDDCFVIALVKPQFETSDTNNKNKGVIKNESIRRSIFKEFEQWVMHSYKIQDKADSGVSGQKGNREKFYKLRPLDANKVN